ncbi:MAG TPA: Hpt domain-containing protein, partial [Kiloniellaceae bacterium]|nr:Hpt domain-containing protein [Kiloniellaceae bacterium]
LEAPAVEVPAASEREDAGFPPFEPPAEAVQAEVAVVSEAAEAVAPAAVVAEAAEGTLLAAIPEGVEPELLDIFLEEARDVLATMGEACDVCQSNPDDKESLTVVRRAFHTLKGSGRMVGLNDLGEVAWRHEQLMNGWLAEKKSATSDLLRLIGGARELFGRWVDALQAGDAAALPVPALLAAADRVAQGKPLDEEKAPAPLAAPQQVAHAEVVAPEPAAPAHAAAEPMVEIELGADFAAVAEAEEPRLSYAALAPAAATDEAAAHSDEIVLFEPVADMAEFSCATVPAEPIAIEIEAFDAGAEAAAFDQPEAAAIVEYAAPPQGAEPAAPAEVEEICIGPLCLSPGLYEIFMTEAHQRLAVLQEESARLVALGASAVSEHARRAVHTLAGIAGTTGIACLADLSHALEQYWNRFAHAALPAAHLSLVQDCVARLGEMVASIEAGRLPDAASDLIATLGVLEDEQTILVAEPAEAPAPDEIDAGAGAAPAAEAATDPVAAVGGTSIPGPLDVSALIQEIKPAGPAPVFERREVADEIDDQLLPIFVEEAETLVPDTSAQLR